MALLWLDPRGTVCDMKEFTMFSYLRAEVSNLVETVRIFGISSSDSEHHHIMAAKRAYS